MLEQQPQRRIADHRPKAFWFTALSVVIIAALIHWLPSEQIQPDSTWDAGASSESNIRSKSQPLLLGATEKNHRSELDEQLDHHFQRSVVMLHAKQYDYALMELEKVIIISPRMPEAYINIGFAHIGLSNFHEAEEAFMTAIDLRPELTNAFYGLAVALEGIGDLAGAIGAMQSFVHLSDPGNPYLLKAEAALWEWRELHQKQRVSANHEPGGVLDVQEVSAAPPSGE